MLDAGLNIIPCSDDPGMFPTTLNNEYTILNEQIGASRDQLGRMALRADDASWLPDDKRAALRAEVEESLAELNVAVV